ncbi:MAG: SDR family NAD(P)-dependent oxidoreductase [Propionibacteriaceae bacterium]
MSADDRTAPSPDSAVRPVAVVTGASSGIGAATARALAADGFRVVCAARRADRITSLATEIDGQAVPCDVTDPDQVAALAATVGAECALLVNNAGGALGQETVSEADFAAWQTMYTTNVIGAGAVTKALLPALRAAAGQVVFITSTAAEAPYEGGAGYCGVKAAERSLVGALRLEIVADPVRVVEIAPGMVHTDEFSLTRFGGDLAKANAVYAGVAEPLVAEDIADCVRWVASRPDHVNIDQLVVRPRAQAANHKVHRTA